ncbi:hypothetical protein T310_8876, partial [Rasamsonia emersonii CBS 393.64]
QYKHTRARRSPTLFSIDRSINLQMDTYLLSKDIAISYTCRTLLEKRIDMADRPNNPATYVMHIHNQNNTVRKKEETDRYSTYVQYSTYLHADIFFLYNPRRRRRSQEARPGQTTPYHTGPDQIKSNQIRLNPI